ncbi:MAG: hypothetical protein IPK14_11915 [Blastocatellia bacterium]|nr:hypothetical protein [Blastocatellia bacterium]
MSPWVKDPNAGGKKVPESVQNKVKKRILTYAEKHHVGTYTKLDIRFRGQFCYIDAYKEPYVSDDFPPPGYPESRETFIERLRNTPIHLCRLRYFGDEEGWGFAFFTYSNEKYELSVFPDGSFYGSPEDAFAASAVYLYD